MQSCLPFVVDAIGPEWSAVAGTPAGMVVVRAAGLRVRGGMVTSAGDAVPRAGEQAVFCRPVVTAPVLARRDGRMLADAWLPDLVRLGEMERHLGDGVIEAIVDAELEKGRLRPRERRRLMSYPLVIRLMIAMTLMPDVVVLRGARAPGRAAGGRPVRPGMAHPDGEGHHRVAAADPGGRDGKHLLAGGRAAHLR